MMVFTEFIRMPAAIGLATAFMLCPPDDTGKKDTLVRVSGHPVVLTAEDGSSVSAKSISFSVADGAQDAHASDHRVHAIIVMSDENGEVKVERINEDISAWLNGKKVNDGQIELKDGYVIIRDESGDVIKKMRMAVDDGAPGQRRVMFRGEDGVQIEVGPDVQWRGKVSDGGDVHFAPRDNVWVSGDDLHFAPGGGAWVSDGHGVAVVPKGRIGIVMGGLDEGALKELKIDNEDAFIITEVIADGPAAKAGLKSKDIVVRVNGQSASMDSIRTLVGESGDGDVIKLRVLRDGKPHDIKVKVEGIKGEAPVAPKAPDARKFDMKDIPFEDFDFDIQFGDEYEFEIDTDHLHHMLQRFEVELDQDDLKQAMERLHRLAPRMRELPAIIQRGHGEFDADAFKEHLNHALRDLEIEFDHEDMKRKLEESLHQHLNDDVRQRIHDALQGVQGRLDPETRAKIEASMKGAFDRLREHGIDVDELPMMELIPHGDGEHVIILEEAPDAPGQPRAVQPRRLRVAPAPPQAPGAAQPRALRAPRADDAPAADDRLERIEKRLDRLERLLERLADRLGADEMA